MCHFCCRSGHWKAACRVGLLCFYCRQPGHLAKVCLLHVQTTAGNKFKWGAFKGERREEPWAGGGGEIVGRKDDLVVRILLSKDLILALVEGTGVLLHLEVSDTKEKASVETGHPHTFW